MIGQFRATLYDLFGYLIPGIVTAVGLLLVGVAISGTGHGDLAWVAESAPAVLALVLCYALGHLSQAAGNLVLPTEHALVYLEPGEYAADVLRRAKQLLGERIGIDAAALEAERCMALMGECRTLVAPDEEHEMYVYREGFYRGMAMASAVLVVAFVVTAMRGSARVALPGAAICVGTRGALLVGAACLVAAGLFVARLWRFQCYRVHEEVDAFLAAATMKAAH